MSCNSHTMAPTQGRTEHKANTNSWRDLGAPTQKTHGWRFRANKFHTVTLSMPRRLRCFGRSTRSPWQPSHHGPQAYICPETARPRTATSPPSEPIRSLPLSFLSALLRAAHKPQWRGGAGRTTQFDLMFRDAPTPASPPPPAHEARSKGRLRFSPSL